MAPIIPYYLAPKLCSHRYTQLRSAGYRLIYEVDNQEIVVFVIAVSKKKIMKLTIKQEIEQKPKSTELRKP